MYGTVGIFKVKPDRVDDFIALNEEWNRTIRPTLPEGGAGIMYRLDKDPNTFILAAAAPSKKAYFELADNPEQDKWFQRLAETFAAEPEWNDGEIIQHDLG